MDSFGGSGAVMAGALADVFGPVTDKFQSSACRGRSMSPEPDTTPFGVCMLNIWHQI